MVSFWIYKKKKKLIEPKNKLMKKLHLDGHAHYFSDQIQMCPTQKHKQIKQNIEIQNNNCVWQLNGI